MTTLYRTSSFRGKWLFIVLVVVTLQASARSEQDSARVTINEVNISIEAALLKIEAQTGITVFYAKQHLSGGDIVPKIAMRNVSVDEALSTILKGKNLTWKIKDGGITITKKPEESKLAKPISSQDTIPQATIKGTVTSDEGLPMIGATVQIKETTIGTTTNKNGQFSLSPVVAGSTIIISYTGYQYQEFTVMPPEVLVARLKKNIESLDEQVVIAYGTSSRRKLTGSISRITGKDISKQPVSNPLAAMIGRMPGVQITQNTGIPGGDFKVQIRGRNSISQGSDPFYIVDGVPFSGTSISSGMFSIVNGGSPLNFINPADIESIEVLKDADATAIYGSRGANGVILITTKKGKVGKTKIDLNFYQGVGKVAHFMKMLNTDQYLEMRREAFANDGIAISPNTPNSNDLKWDNSRYTDWQKRLIGGRADYTDVQASVSGGSLNTQFNIGAGIHRETTVFPSSYSDTKASVHFSINHTSEDKKFKILFTGNYLDDRNNLNRSDFTLAAITLPPNAPSVYKPDGSINWENSTWSNPYAELKNEYNAQSNNLISNTNISYELLKGLSLKASLGYTNMRMKEVNTLPLSSFDPSFLITSTNSHFNDNSIKTWLVEPQIEYKKKLGAIKLSALMGSTFQQNLKEGTLLLASGYTSDALLKDVKSAGTVSVSSSNYSKYKYNGIFGRVNLEYAEKLIANITARRDGSSRFGPGNQFSNFGALGVAWIFSNENFLNNIPFLSFGKLRASYGVTGNDQMRDYGFIDLWLSTTYGYSGAKGLYANNLFNSDFAWEVNRKLEGAVELGALNNRVYLIIDYYKNRSGNQLLGNPLPTMTGFNSIIENLNATVQNEGWEFELTSINIDKRNLKWQISINLTIQNSKLVSYPGFEKSSTAPQLYVVGYPLNVAKVYNYTGVNSENGVYEFRNKSDSATSLPSYLVDRVGALSLVPRFYGGLQNSLTYGNLSLDFLLQFVKQNGPNYYAGFANAPGFPTNQPIEVLSRWRAPGDITEIQKFTQSTSSVAYNAYSNVNSFGSNKYSDASFIRLKNLSISYQLPKMIQDKLKTEHLRVFIQGQNLFTITKYKGLDPETLSFTRLPTLRVLSVGAQMSW